MLVVAVAAVMADGYGTGWGLHPWPVGALMDTFRTFSLTRGNKHAVGRNNRSAWEHGAREGGGGQVVVAAYVGKARVGHEHERERKGVKGRKVADG